MWELETRIQEIKRIVKEADGKNVADATFARRVEDLISVFYDDIGEVRYISLKSLFDLFLVRCLYVNRHSTDANVLDYLSDVLTRFLWSRELFPSMGLGGRSYVDLLTTLLQETRDRLAFQNLFEAYRKLGDNALFITGVFPKSLAHRRRWGWRRRRWQWPSNFDKSYFIRSGKDWYRLASDHLLAEWTGQRPILGKLSHYFEIYMDALNEVSDRYIMGFDMDLIADKMLDNFNRYRRTEDERYLEYARKYAAILKVNESSFPRLFRRRPRYVVL